VLLIFPWTGTDTGASEGFKISSGGIEVIATLKKLIGADSTLCGDEAIIGCEVGICTKFGGLRQSPSLEIGSIVCVISGCLSQNMGRYSAEGGVRLVAVAKDGIRRGGGRQEGESIIPESTGGRRGAREGS
jgi:hypothetical protein